MIILEMEQDAVIADPQPEAAPVKRFETGGAARVNRQFLEAIEDERGRAVVQRIELLPGARRENDTVAHSSVDARAGPRFRSRS